MRGLTGCSVDPCGEHAARGGSVCHKKKNKNIFKNIEQGVS